MARLLTVVNEREKIKRDYRHYLEEEYIKKQRESYEQEIKLKEQKEKEELINKIPVITYNLMRAKYKDLKQGIDNIDYIKKAVEIEQKRKNLKEELNVKYNYQEKKIINEGEEIQEGSEDKYIKQFKSGVKNQLMTGNVKMSQEEVLRSHVKNWKMLNLKQRRIILGFINKRRANESKKEFLKELNLLGQKIAYDKKMENSH